MTGAALAQNTVRWVNAVGIAPYAVGAQNSLLFKQAPSPRFKRLPPLTTCRPPRLTWFSDPRILESDLRLVYSNILVDISHQRQ